MRKIKYFYNTHTLRYEKLITPFRVRLLKVFGFLAAALCTGLIIVTIAYKYFPSANEKRLQQQNEDLRQSYAIISQEIAGLRQEMNELERRDNEIYRSIFEASPIPDSARLKQMEQTKEVQLVRNLGESELIYSITQQLNNLKLKTAYQAKSYEVVGEMLRNKEKLLAAIPAIQPVSNKNLNRIASGFGVRIDPVYKVAKMHAGLDFTAPQGTPIYATADGVIKEASYNTGGYGNNVVINHGYGYETLYAHMYRVKIKQGETVKRGEVIGWVGSTGKSTGPHCHYEVHKNGQPVDPVYYFYNDLNPEQFDRILKLAAAGNQSLD